MKAPALYIKNMVCDRCLAAVRTILQKVEVGFTSVQLGEVILTETPSSAQLEKLANTLNEAGFELLDDSRSRIVEKIKNTIVTLIHRDEEILNIKLSALLSEKLNKDYHYLSTLFSSVEGVTIEKYAILQRIERVKELLTYDELTLSEIAFQMGYSSVQHLSQQFKKEIGLTPTQFRALSEKKRKPLDKV